MNLLPQPSLRLSCEGTVRLRFLDGLRGWGAVFVLLYHVFAEALPVTQQSAEFLRHLVPFNGTLAVLVFFLVSGFSLSTNYLVHGDWAALLRMAAGRYFRLVVPIFLACLAVHLAMVTGLLDTAAPRLVPFSLFLNFSPTIEHLLRFSLFDVFFNYRAEDTYIGPLWTMPIELAGSALVFAAVILLRPASYRSIPLMMLAALLLCSPWGLSSMLALFPIGVVMADWFARSPACLPIPAALLLAGGCIMAALAPLNRDLPGMLTAIAISAGCIWLPATRALLEAPLSAWLGRISFPLYLIHAPIMCVMGEPLMRDATSAPYRLGIGLLTCVVAFAAAIVFTPASDLGVRLSHLIGSFFGPREGWSARSRSASPKRRGLSDPEAPRQR